MEEQNCNVELYFFTWENKKNEAIYSSLLICGVHDFDYDCSKKFFRCDNAICTRLGIRVNKLKSATPTYYLRKLFEINKLPEDLVYTYIPSNQYLQSYKPNGNKNKELGRELLKYLEAVEKKNDLITYLIEELKKIPKD